MALFKFNYDRPGKGVEKDEPEQTGIVRFFVIFFRRLSKFVQLNLTFMIPVFFTILLMVGLYFLPYFLGVDALPAVAFGQYSINVYNLYVVPLPFILLSVFYSGMMVVARRLANKVYVFVWSEYWQGVKANWKQFLINGIVCYVAYFMLTFAFMFYGSKVTEAGGFYYVPWALILVLMVIFVFLQYYVPVMIVSVNMRMKPIYKNSFILCIMGAIKNLLISGVFIAFYLVYNYLAPYMGLTLLLSVILFVLIVPAFLTYTVVYITYPLIKSCVIDPFYQKDKKEEKVEEQQESVFSYKEIEGLEENKSEYVYVNGKLVKKDELPEE